MQVKVGNKVFNSDDQPVMIILSKHERNLIENMADNNNKFCVYPATAYWTRNSFKKIKKWMKKAATSKVQRRVTK